MFIGALAIIAVSVVGYVSYRKVVGPEDTAAPIDAAPSVTRAPSEPSSPLVVPIDDAQEVVAEINGNSVEEELLDDLGLDSVGRPQVPGYLFTTLDASGAALTVQVDATTGNYSIESTTGLGFRTIDGVTYQRAAATDEWAEADITDFQRTQPFGLDGVVIATDLLPSSLDAYVTIVSSEVVNGVTGSIHSVDVAALRIADPDLLASWSTPFGLDSATLGNADGEPVTITMMVDDERTVQSFDITPPAPGPSVTYRLEAVYDAAPLISL
jgi:hypothetical protein